jgi:exopolysaccharide biosynthesis predicted pyruvyltransferase EpsI
MGATSFTDIIGHLRSCIYRTLDPLVSNVSDFCVLDFPNHPNVGDSAIWGGEMSYFSSRGLAPKYVCTKDDIDWAAVDRLSGPIFLHGGGNFGDVWPDHQAFREDVLNRFPHRDVIQLPQTVYFSSTQAAAASRRALNQHNRFVLLVRDEASVATAESMLNTPATLVPDMAFCLGPMARATKPTTPLMLLLRTDHEGIGHNLSTAGLSAETASDWMQDVRGFYKTAQIKTALNPKNWLADRRQFAFFNEIAHRRVLRGLSLLASGDYVITDRLHGHILCLLQNIPHTVIDNNYGKISQFIKAWTSDFEHLHLAHDIGEAMAYYRASTGTPQ